MADLERRHYDVLQALVSGPKTAAEVLKVLLHDHPGTYPCSKVAILVVLRKAGLVVPYARPGGARWVPTTEGHELARKDSELRAAVHRELDRKVRAGVAERARG